MRAPVACLALSAALGAGCGGASDPPRGEPAAAASWARLAPATLERTEVAAARVGRHIYVTGGFEERTDATTAATERYDIARDRWTRVADMPVPLNHAAAATYRGDVYVLGGYKGRSNLSDETRGS
jgi:N-acetylneuraminic acid mutarotase